MDARRVACQRGFTLVEVMMACFILATGVLGAVGLIDNANKVTVKSKARESAVSLDRPLIEGVRDIPYAQLTRSGLAADLQSQPGLSSEPGSSMYTIRRRGFAYSVDVATCEIDDPRDGIGPQSGGAFCGANYNPGGTGGSGGGSSTCSGAITGSGSGNVDVNGNKIDASFCLALSNSLIWSTCNLLN